MAKSYLQRISIPSLLKIQENELDYLGKHLKISGYKNIALFYSAGIEELFGERIDITLNKANIKVIHKDTIDEINIENIIHTAFSIPKSVEVLVGIGGGKALDYSKYCAHVLALPFISVPTSLSNDGFCSPNSSLLVENKRKSVTASIPYGVIIDINAVQTSPESTIYSGIGDLISKITAGWDWKQAVKLENEKFNDFAYLISQNTVFDFLSYQNQNIRDVEFIYHLANSLLMNGISMEIASSSRPASGSEHLISHSLDMNAQKPVMHGLQVGLATYLCSYLQNNQFDVVKKFLENTGFFSFMEKCPLYKNDFQQAIIDAPNVKENFYTVLSSPEKVDLALEFIENDPVLKKILI